MEQVKARAGPPLPRWTQVLAPGGCLPGPKNRNSRTKLPHNSNLALIVYSAGPPSAWRLTIEPFPNRSWRSLQTPSCNLSCSWEYRMSDLTWAWSLPLPREDCQHSSRSPNPEAINDTSFYSLWPGKSYPSHIFHVIPVPWGHPLLGLFFNGQDVHRFSRDVWPNELQDGMCTVLCVHSAPSVHSVHSGRPTHAILWLCKSGAYCRLTLTESQSPFSPFLSVVWEPFQLMQSFPADAMINVIFTDWGWWCDDNGDDMMIRWCWFDDNGDDVMIMWWWWWWFDDGGKVKPLWSQMNKALQRRWNFSVIIVPITQESNHRCSSLSGSTGITGPTKITEMHDLLACWKGEFLLVMPHCGSWKC